MPPDDKRKSDALKRTEQGPDQPRESSEENPDRKLEQHRQKERDYVAKTLRRGYV
jgi:hypothetical protein